MDGVSFDLAAGESLAIVGESGCGKTLTGRALAGLTPDVARTTGSIRLRGTELSESGEEEWRRVRGRDVAIVFQDPGSAFDPVQTIGSQIVEAIRAHRDVDRREARRIAVERLREVGFPDPARGLTEFAHRLSGGLQQRAFLAMALAADPAILVADEPTTALDATVSARVLDLFDRLRAARGLAVVLISHDLGSVAAHSDRAIVMYAGRIAEEGSTADVFREPRHPYTRGLLASLPRVEPGASRRRFSAIAGAVPDLTDRPSGVCAFAPRCPDRFEPCDRREPELYRTGRSRARCFLYEG